jgi:hypothetical protein
LVRLASVSIAVQLLLTPLRDPRNMEDNEKLVIDPLRQRLMNELVPLFSMAD